MTNETTIKHKHAGHLIVIEGHAFKANDAGMWDLTDIWQTLGLPKGKQPGRWRGKEKDRLSQSQNLDVRNMGDGGHRATATKRATIAYAGWVSPEFEDMVYDAFEAILELPEVALIVADHMHKLGHTRSAEIITRMVSNDKCRWASLGHRNTAKGLKAAVGAGHLTTADAHTLALRDGLKGFKL